MQTVNRKQLPPPGAAPTPASLPPFWPFCLPQLLGDSGNTQTHPHLPILSGETDISARAAIPDTLMHPTVTHAHSIALSLSLSLFLRLQPRGATDTQTNSSIERGWGLSAFPPAHFPCCNPCPGELGPHHSLQVAFLKEKLHQSLEALCPESAGPLCCLWSPPELVFWFSGGEGQVCF